MIFEFTYTVLFAFKMAIIGWFITTILMDEHAPLSFYYDLLMKYSKFPYLVKPLGLCNICFTGQLTFWSYFFINKIYGISTIGYNWTSHLYAIALSIFFVSIINKMK